MVVASEWTGTTADRHDMEKLQLDQVLRRNFGRLAAFGFASTLLCSWELVLASLSLSLLNGGTAGLFWNFLIVCPGLLVVYLSIAELGSMIPTSGGQYYWVAILAPRSCHKYLSYVTGWLCATSWATGISSVAFIAGTAIQGLLVLNLGSNYTYENWHGSLLSIAVSVVAIVFNTILAKKLPLIEGLLFLLHLLGIVLLIPLWVLLPIRTDRSIFTEYYNGGGWSSTGVSAMVGMLPVLLSITGLDCSVHMAEEIKDSSRMLPISLMMGYFINAVLVFFVILTVIFTGGPVEELLKTETGYPFIELFYRATKSYAATNAMTAIMIINLTASSIAVLATASRQLWSFARNKGLPFSTFLAPQVLPGDIPRNALFVSLGITIALCLINIGSSAALNAIFSLSTGSMLTSYIITIACMIRWRLSGKPVPASRFTLGKWGLSVNIAAVCFLSPVYFFAFFPSTANPTLVTMNWAALMFGGLIIISTIYYVFWGRYAYTPPTDQITRVLIMDRFYGDSSQFRPAAEQKRVEVVAERQIEI